MFEVDFRNNGIVEFVLDNNDSVSMVFKMLCGNFNSESICCFTSS